MSKRGARWRISISARGRYEEVEPVLEMLVRKTDRRDNRTLRELYYRLAKTAGELEKNDKALKHYRAAYDIDSTDLPTLRGMADLLHQMEDWDRAFKIYQTILVHHRDSQEPEQIVEIFYRLGNIKLKLGERKKALNMFEKALEIDPFHQQTLDAVIELKARQGEWEAVIEAKRALITRADEDRSFELLNDIGSIYQEKQNNPEKAITAYRDALEQRPDSHPVIHRLIELYSSTKQWKRAVEMVLMISEMESSPRLRARYLYTAAVINRDEIRSLDDAVELFDRSLDQTFSEVDATTEIQAEQFKAFEALDRICTQKKDWKTQERSYRKMIKRLPQDGQVGWKVRLWHALGEIYRTRLRQYDAAIKAFEIATQLDGSSVQRHEILAELYVLSGPEHFDKAVQQHQILIKGEPYRIESYKALRQIYMDTKQYDKAWCICATLSFLKKADAEEQRFYEQHRQKGFVRARATMTDELWRKYVFHPEEDVYVGTILGVIAPVVGAMTAQAHKKFGLKKKERRDLANDKLLFAKVFHYASSLLRVQEADLFLSDRASGLYMAHTVERPSFVVGQDLLQGRPEKELAFVIARQLSYLRPEHFLRNVLQASPSHMKTVFLAALRLCNPQFPVPPAEEVEIDRFLKEMRKKIHASHLDQLSTIVQRFVKRTSDVNLARWLAAVELTASRVGLIACNDLEVAAKMVSSEPATVGSLPPKERVKELVLYSVSEEYFVVRDQLGLTIAT
jgi:tetratricopeptide (TPR) repeat protein